MGAKWQRVKVKLPKSYTSTERQAIAQEIIDFMVDRTDKGKDVRNKSFPKYSKGYTKSLDFKIAGKSKGEVNLQLSGDMLADIELLSHKKGELLIGFENNTLSNDKADGNIRGTYGAKVPSRKKSRKFLGIMKSDLSDILRNDFPLRGEIEKRLASVAAFKASQEAIATAAAGASLQIIDDSEEEV